MADEKKQLVLDLLARNKMRKDTTEAADDLDKLGKAAEETDKKTEKLGDTSEKTGHQTDKMGNSLSDTKGRISGLDKEIESIDKELKTMSASFADAGTAAERNDISKAIRRTQTELRSLTKNRDVLKGLLPDEQEIEQEGQKVKAKMGSLFSEIGELGGPALAIGLAAAAPAIGAVLSGAIVGGVGLGGIVGGVLIATKDARVQTAIGELKTHLGDELKDAAQPFVPVTIDAIGKVRRAIDGIDLKQLFSDAAKESGPLIDGVTTLISELGGAVQNLIHNAGPEVDAIGKGIGQIGTALANGLNSLADDGPAASDALSNIFTLISGGITVTFELVDALTKVYEIGRKFGGSGVIDAMKALGDATTPVSGKLDEMTQNAIAAATGTDDLAKAQSADQRAAEGQRDALAEVSKELRAQTDPAFAVLDATDKVRDAKKSLADAEHKYGQNSEQARNATRKLAEAAFDLQGDVGKLGGAFDGKLTPTMKRTLSAAGLTKAQIKQVEDELKRAKKAADAYDGKYVAEIITNYTYNVGGNDYNREANRGAFSGNKRAAGGPIVRDVPYLVGENGPEIVIPDASGRVLSAGASRGLVTQAAMAGMGLQRGGGGRTIAQVEVVGSDPRLVSLLKYLIRTANVFEVDQ